MILYDFVILNFILFLNLNRLKLWFFTPVHVFEGTAIEEGVSICYAICEELLKLKVVIIHIHQKFHMALNLEKKNLFPRNQKIRCLAYF